MKRSIFVLLYLLLTFPLSIMAQPTTPLTLWIAGDLYSAPADGSAVPTRLTTNGTISDPAISPDSRLIAYRALAPVGQEALGRIQTTGLIADFDMPTDLFILDTATGQTGQVAAQPENASLLVEGQPDNAIVRSSPAWTSDGALIWAEFDFGALTGRLLEVDLTAGTIRALTEELPIDALGRAPQVLVGRTQVAVINDAPDRASRSVVTYSLEGTSSTPLVTQLYVPPAGASPLYVTWAQAGDGDLLAFLASDGTWTLFNQAGEIVEGGAPELTTAAPDSVRVRIGHVPETGFYWEAFDPLQPGSASQAFPAGPSQIALSPDGRALASLGYPAFGGVGVWTGSAIIALAGTGSTVENGLLVGMVMWGAGVWQVNVNL